MNKIYCNMKKFAFCVILAFILTFSFAGCKKEFDYFSCVSELRSDIFLYEDDEVSVKIYCSEKEQPYAADGIKGNMNPLCEIFVTLPKSPKEVIAEVEGFGGDMNYKAVDGCYYLSFTAERFKKDSVKVKLTVDGESTEYTALSVLYDGVIDGKKALSCVVEHDRERFESLTQNGTFAGEIYIRLLADEGCYYYVGVCSRDGSVKAYLLDGERGKIITTKEIG